MKIKTLFLTGMLVGGSLIASQEQNVNNHEIIKVLEKSGVLPDLIKLICSYFYDFEQIVSIDFKYIPKLIVSKNGKYLAYINGHAKNLSSDTYGRVEIYDVIKNKIVNIFPVSELFRTDIVAISNCGKKMVLSITNGPNSQVAFEEIRTDSSFNDRRTVSNFCEKSTCFYSDDSLNVLKNSTTKDIADCNIIDLDEIINKEKETLSSQVFKNNNIIIISVKHLNEYKQVSSYKVYKCSIIFYDLSKNKRIEKIEKIDIDNLSPEEFNFERLSLSQNAQFLMSYNIMDKTKYIIIFDLINKTFSTINLEECKDLKKDDLRINNAFFLNNTVAIAATKAYPGPSGYNPLLIMQYSPSICWNNKEDKSLINELEKYLGLDVAKLAREYIGWIYKANH